MVRFVIYKTQTNSPSGSVTIRVRKSGVEGGGEGGLRGIRLDKTVVGECS